MPNNSGSSSSPNKKVLKAHDSLQAARDVCSTVKLECEPNVVHNVREVFRDNNRNKKKTEKATLTPGPVPLRSDAMNAVQQAMARCSQKARTIAALVQGCKMAESIVSELGGLDNVNAAEFDLLRGALQTCGESQTTRAAAARMLRAIGRCISMMENSGRITCLEHIALVVFEHGIIKARNDRSGPRPYNLTQMRDWMQTNADILEHVNCMQQFYDGICEHINHGEFTKIKELATRAIAQEPNNSVLRKYFQNPTIQEAIRAAVKDGNESKLAGLKINTEASTVDLNGIPIPVAVATIQDCQWGFFLQLLAICVQQCWNVSIERVPWKLLDGPRCHTWFVMLATHIAIPLTAPMFLGLALLFNVIVPVGSGFRSRALSKQLEKSMPTGKLRRKIQALCDKAHLADVQEFIHHLNAMCSHITSRQINNLSGWLDFFKMFEAEPTKGFASVAKMMIALIYAMRGLVANTRDHVEKIARFLDEISNAETLTELKEALMGVRVAFVREMAHEAFKKMGEKLAANLPRDAMDVFNGMANTWHFVALSQITAYAQKIDTAMRAISPQGLGNDAVQQNNNIQFYLQQGEDGQGDAPGAAADGGEEAEEEGNGSDVEIIGEQAAEVVESSDGDL
ncbi:unnamed protein product [Amoebophrya sp. A25]|nr:unnamed protein product [Amoebophrya sp. A25]|eukprot:GSA25T00019936001.1